MRATARLSAAAFACAWMLSGPASADAPDVVATIKPAHSLVSAVMEGVGKPELIMRGAASPHTFAMRPSHARAIQNADLVFWIDPRLETSLAGAIRELAGPRAVGLAGARGVVSAPAREGGAFEAHEHDRGHGDRDDGGREAAREDDDGHDDDDRDHDDGERVLAEHLDPHVWLDPVNARAMVRAIVRALSEADPANAGAYAANGRALDERLQALVREVAAELEPYRGRPFIVLHDAYLTFERRFGMTAAGSVSVNPERAPGARRIAEIREKIRDADVKCAFSEPQFPSRLIHTIVEGMDTRIGVLDPLGAFLEDGPDLYFAVIRGLVASFGDCLRD